MIVVVGAGGHAKVAIDVLRLNGWTIAGCTGNDPLVAAVLDVPVLGDDGVLPSLRRDGVDAAFVAIGNNTLRHRIARRLLHEYGFALPCAVHPGAIVSSSAKVDQGAAVCAGAVINASAWIEEFAIINTAASIDHDCHIGRAAHVAPACGLAGNVTIGDRAFLGVGSCVVPERTIGADAVVGAGSVVVHDLPAACKAYGNPARVKIVKSPTFRI